MRYPHAGDARRVKCVEVKCAAVKSPAVKRAGSYLDLSFRRRSGDESNSQRGDSEVNGPFLPFSRCADRGSFGRKRAILPLVFPLRRTSRETPPLAASPILSIVITSGAVYVAI